VIAVPGIDEIFVRAKREGRTALIAYLVAGDPDVATTRAVMDAIVEAGVDIVELGIPYGDPLADGPTIAAAAHRAVAAGIGIDAVVDLARGARVPTILFTYVNPIVQYGIERFAAVAKQAGVAGAIVPDVPLEELAVVRDALHAAGLMMPLLVAPTTPDARARVIAQASDGFVYLVSRLGVTGAKASLDVGAIRDQLGRLRTFTERPLAVGFGISEPSHIAAIRDAADGVIVGSALIDSFAGKRGRGAAEAATAFIRLLREAAGSASRAG